MPPLNSAITGYVAGNTLNVARIVSRIPTGRTLAKAWLTLKAKITDADPGALQKTITSTLTSSGQILDIGNGLGSYPVGTGSIVFILSIADTLTLGTLITYQYDIKFKMDNTDVSTLEFGPFILVPSVSTITV